MAAAHPFIFNLMLTLVVVLSMHGGLCDAMSTMKTMSKGQISCQMCAACENPCQPPPSLPSPPPPYYPSPLPPYYPFPPPPSPESYYCPPPPSPPTGPPSYFPPRPPGINPRPPKPESPAVPIGCEYPPYYPYYYYCPPPRTAPNSVASRKPNSVFPLIILISFIFHI